MDLEMPYSAVAGLKNPMLAWQRCVALEASARLRRYAMGEKVPMLLPVECAFLRSLLQSGGELELPAVVPYVPPGPISDEVLQALRCDAAA